MKFIPRLNPGSKYNILQDTSNTKLPISLSVLIIIIYIILLILFIIVTTLTLITIIIPVLFIFILGIIVIGDSIATPIANNIVQNELALVKKMDTSKLYNIMSYIPVINIGIIFEFMVNYLHHGKVKTYTVKG